VPAVVPSAHCGPAGVAGRGKDVAATIALRAALPKGLLETVGRRQATIVVIKVPAASWCEAVNQAFCQLLEKTRPDAWPGRFEICTVIRDGSHRTHSAADGNEEVANAINRQKSIVGITTDPTKLLPRALSAAPDFYVEAWVPCSPAAEINALVQFGSCNGVQ
jgi:folylpolyglutamate synthase/dihydropteroate synthase